MQAALRRVNQIATAIAFGEKLAGDQRAGMQRLVQVRSQMQCPAQGHGALCRLDAVIAQALQRIFEGQDDIVDVFLAVERVYRLALDIRHRLRLHIDVALETRVAANPAAIDPVPVGPVVALLQFVRQSAYMIRPECRLPEQPAVARGSAHIGYGVRHLGLEILFEARVLA